MLGAGLHPASSREPPLSPIRATGSSGKTSEPAEDAAVRVARPRGHSRSGYRGPPHERLSPLPPGPTGTERELALSGRRRLRPCERPNVDRAELPPLPGAEGVPRLRGLLPSGGRADRRRRRRRLHLHLVGRPPPSQLGTVEVRAVDVQMDAAGSSAIAALVQAIAAGSWPIRATPTSLGRRSRSPTSRPPATASTPRSCSTRRRPSRPERPAPCARLRPALRGRAGRRGGHGGDRADPARGQRRR